jgi:nitroimidazol reductase NimA-like FMN-containing flavoprotein (pyridoxamine 5'-phosphate oxidase superfamily)
MDTQELNKELENPGAQALLRSSLLCRLAYLGQDSLPRVIPIGFHWNGSRVVVCTATTSPKVRALESRPGVALAIDEGSESGNAKSLQIRGQAALETVDGVPDEYLEGAAKSLDAEQRAEFEKQVRSLYDQMVRISIEPHWARFYDFGAGRLPGFLTRLVNGR